MQMPVYMLVLCSCTHAYPTKHDSIECLSIFSLLEACQSLDQLISFFTLLVLCDIMRWW